MDFVRGVVFVFLCGLTLAAMVEIARGLIGYLGRFTCSVIFLTLIAFVVWVYFSQL